MTQFKEIIGAVRNALMLFTGGRRIKFTWIAYSIGAFLVSYYLLYKFLYVPSWVPTYGNFYLTASERTVQGFSAAWERRVLVFSNIVYPVFKDVFYSSEDYDWSYSAVYWGVPFKTFYRFLNECSMLYLFDNENNHTTFTGGKLPWQYYGYPFLHFSLGLAELFQVFWNKQFDFYHVLTVKQAGDGLIDYPYAKPLEGIRRDLAYERLTLPGSNLFLQMIIYLKALGVSKPNLLVGVYLFLHNVVFGFIGAVNIIFYIFYSILIPLLYTVLYLGLGIFIGFITDKLYFLSITVFHFYSLNFSNWEAVLSFYLPTILRYSWYVLFLGPFFCFLLGFAVILHLAFFDWIKEMVVSLIWLFARLSFYSSRFSLHAGFGAARAWTITKYESYRFYDLYYHIERLNAWGHWEEKRGIPIVDLENDYGHRARRNPITRAFWPLPFFVFYILWHYRGWLDSYSLFIVKDFHNYYWKQTFGYPQRFQIDTYVARVQNHIGIYDCSFQNFKKVKNLVYDKYLIHRAWVNKGEYNPRFFEPVYFHKETMNHLLENYEVYRFLVLPTFVSVLPTLIVIAMSRKIRLILTPFYDTITVIFWGFFFFYVFGTVTIGYSFFLRLWFDFVFQTLHEGPLYNDVVNINPVDSEAVFRENYALGYINALDNLMMYGLKQIGSRKGFSFERSVVEAYAGKDKEVKGFIPDKKFLPPRPRLPDGYVGTFAQWVLEKPRSYNFQFWKVERLFFDYNAPGFKTRNNGDMFVTPIVRNKKELFLVSNGKFANRKISFAEVVVRQKYWSRRTKFNGYTHVPKQLTWPYHEKRNDAIGKVWKLVAGSKHYFATLSFVKQYLWDSFHGVERAEVMDKKLVLKPTPTRLYIASFVKPFTRFVASHTFFKYK